MAPAGARETLLPMPTDCRAGTAGGGPAWLVALHRAGEL